MKPIPSLIALAAIALLPACHGDYDHHHHESTTTTTQTTETAVQPVVAPVSTTTVRTTN